MKLEGVIERFESEPRGLTLTGFKGSSFAFWFSELSRLRKAPSLIIVPTAEVAENLVSDVHFFSGDPSPLAQDDKEDILYYPAWEPHPYDTLSPHPDILMARMEVLYQMLQKNQLTVVTTINALFQKVIPKEAFIDQITFIKKGKMIDRDLLIRLWTEGGYSRVSTVEDRGCFSIRGGIIDIFPPLAEAPYRLECVGDEIENLRTFDPGTQRSLKSIENEVAILPIREIIYSQKNIDLAIKKVKHVADEASIPKANRDQILEYLEQKVYFSGIDYYLPFFFERLDDFFSYFSESYDVVYFDKVSLEKSATDFENECRIDYEKTISQKRISSQVADFYLSLKELTQNLSQQKYWNIASLEILEEKYKTISFNIQDNDDIRHDLKRKKISSLEVLEPLSRMLKNFRSEGYAIFFVAHTMTQLKRFQELMGHYGLRFLNSNEKFKLDFIGRFQRADSYIYEVALVLGRLVHGFKLQDEKIIFITEGEIFGVRKKSGETTFVKSSKSGAFISNLSELNTGDPIVHVQHGIGLYQGLHRLSLEQSENDYVLLEYANQDKLYLPVHRLNVIQRYVGAEKEKVQLDKLGGMAWTKTKSRVKKTIEDIAHELLAIYAARQTEQGFQFSPPDSFFHEMEATFPFEETPDQFKAIEDILKDMTSTRPMDRIVCGDVGYGKTEVAIRAAFKAVMDKKQVALLAPTTLLVDQHYRVFQKRLEQFPVNIEMLSRFKSAGEQKKTVERLKQGKVDIVIGTHRLLSSDVDFHDLGLLIIDEEQRFGVVHKEKIKKIKKILDVLTLSATPIPRTLHMALLGIRDISIINTPPHDRLSIRTYITTFNDQTIREAILQEIHRGGQVFFIHNRVESIAKLTKHIQTLVPEAKVHFAHGQMKESLIEHVMLDFLNKKFNVLVCTTIIGSGIDISSANTILIDRADMFGLSTLYQLRGRVGRSRERAYAYLIIPPEDRLSDDAKKRLNVIQGASELGSGFKVASYDLEIRGGGNILGKDQSGHIEAIGFELYTDLLEETIRELKGEDIPDEIDPELHIKIDAYLPQDYVSDMGERLTFYRELALIRSEDDLAEIEAEFRDRYGELPPVALNLFEIMAIKFYLKKLKAKAIDFGNEKAVFTFSDRTPISPEAIVKLVQKEPKKFQLKSDNKLVTVFHTWKDILPFIRRLAEEFSE